jgi:hypothetical protein
LAPDAAPKQKEPDQVRAEKSVERMSAVSLPVVKG